MSKNIVKLKINNGETQLEITGWERLSITRGIERIPNSFDLQMSGKVPDMEYVEVIEGSECQVFIGDDVVVTGYVDRVISIISDNQHIIQVVGRGKCQDLVDCSATYQGMQFKNMTAESIAAALCENFKINVVSEVKTDVVFVQNINLGETAAAVIERVCRVAQLLYYENQYGDLVLSRERNDAVVGALTQGFNVESATFVKGIDQRYSDYIIVMPNAQLTSDISNGASINYRVFEDSSVPRYRPLYIIPDDGDAGFVTAEKRANWEHNRRFARSRMLRVTVTDWRDISGVLYRPNTQIQVNIPRLRIEWANWLIGEVTYRIDETGTRCDLLVMPIGAFTPEPVIPIQGVPTDVVNAAGVGQ